MKKIITGALLLTGAAVFAEGKSEVKKEETKKDPVYKVIPRGSSVIVDGKKIYIKTGKSMCSADRAATKLAEGKVLKDVKCNISKNDPNSKFWKDVTKYKNIRVFDKSTQDGIMKNIEDVEKKEKDARSKHDNVEGSSRIHFDMSIINNDKQKDNKQNNKTITPRKKVESNNKKINKSDSESNQRKTVPKTRIIFIKEEISLDKKKGKVEYAAAKETEVDNIIKNMAKRIAEES